MKLIEIAFLIFVVLVLVRSGNFEATTPVKNFDTSDDCICDDLWDPVCATDGKSYGNSCLLNCAKTQHDNLLGVCKGECPCCKPPYTNEEYDNNKQETLWTKPFGVKLDDVQLEMMMVNLYANIKGQPFKADTATDDKKGQSQTTKNAKLGFSNNSAATDARCVCTSIHAPVCGSNNKTYGNFCSLKCAAQTNPCLTAVCSGECPCCSCVTNVMYSQS